MIIIMPRPPCIMWRKYYNRPPCIMWTNRGVLKRWRSWELMIFDAPRLHSKRRDTCSFNKDDQKDFQEIIVLFEFQDEQYGGGACAISSWYCLSVDIFQSSICFNLFQEEELGEVLMPGEEGGGLLHPWLGIAGGPGSDNVSQLWLI